MDTLEVRVVIYFTCTLYPPLSGDMSCHVLFHDCSVMLLSEAAERRLFRVEASTTAVHLSQARVFHIILCFGDDRIPSLAMLFCMLYS